jgi:hypothetical protein
LHLSSVTLPALYDAADKASLDGQRNYLRARGAQLVLSVVAALSGAVVFRAGAYDLAGFVGLGAFALVLTIQFVVRWQDEQRAWFDGRAAAESIKHLAWRYAMRAEPYLEDANVDARFLHRLTDTLNDVRDLKLAPAGKDQITEWMRETRAADLPTRRSAYIEQRVENQQDWYGTKANAAKKNGRLWRLVLYAVGAVGAVAGLAKGFAVTELDGLGIAATAVSAATAWIATKQYEVLEVSYGLAVQDLAAVHSAEPSVANDDEAWSTFVNDAEDAISREHRMWRASRIAAGSGR